MKRYIFGILALVVLIGGLAAIKASQIGLLIQSGENAKAAGPPPEVVSTAQASVDTWSAKIDAVGSVEASQGVTISNEAPGLVTRVAFESGDKVKKGAVLVELDASVERTQLASAMARLELAQTTLGRVESLVSKGALAREELDQAQSTIKTSAAEVQGLRAQIERKVVRAPFTGRLGIRQVNVGQYLNPGTALTTLQSDSDDFVDFPISQQRLNDVRLGLPVTFVISGSENRTLKGTVAAINSQVDESTRTVTIRAKVDDPEGVLLPGMFVSASITLSTEQKVVLVPTPAVVYAPYGNSVFVVEEETKDGAVQKIARQKFVRTGETRGDFVVVEEGLTGDETLVTAGAFKLRNGSRVSVNNDIKVDAQLAPKPENR